MNDFDWSLDLGRRELVSRLTALDAAARRALLKTLGYPTGYFMSPKMNRAMPWWRRRERDLMCVLETDRHVTAYDLLLDRADVLLDDQWTTVHPHFQVRRGTAWTGLDILSPRRLAEPTRPRLTTLLHHAYSSRGWRYETLDQRLICREPRYGNALHVLEARGFRPSDEDVHLIMELLSARSVRTIADLVQALPDRRAISRSVFALALRGRLALDLERPGPDEVLVSLSREGV